MKSWLPSSSASVFYVQTLSSFSLIWRKHEAEQFSYFCDSYYKKPKTITNTSHPYFWIFFKSLLTFSYCSSYLLLIRDLFRDNPGSHVSLKKEKERLSYGLLEASLHVKVEKVSYNNSEIKKQDNDYTAGFKTNKQKREIHSAFSFHPILRGELPLTSSKFALQVTTRQSTDDVQTKP